MNKNTIISIGAGILAVIAVGVSVVSLHSKPIVQTVKTSDGVTVTKRLGGTSPEFTSPYLTVNNVTEWYESMPMRTGTTTVCSFPNPLVAYGGASSTQWTASTTLQYVSMHVNLATTSQIIYDIGTSTTGVGTSSTVVSNYVVAANASSSAVGWIAPSWSGGVIGSGIWTDVVASLPPANSNGFCEAEFTQY